MKDKSKGTGVKKYPEAAIKKACYELLAKELAEVKNEIISASTAVRTNISANSSLTENAMLEGAYYDKYVMKKDDWVNEAEIMRGKFNNFVEALNVCIANALKLKKLWESRETEYRDEV